MSNVLKWPYSSFRIGANSGGSKTTLDYILEGKEQEIKDNVIDAIDHFEFAQLSEEEFEKYVTEFNNRYTANPEARKREYWNPALLMAFKQRGLNVDECFERDLTLTPYYVK